MARLGVVVSLSSPISSSRKDSSLLALSRSKRRVALNIRRPLQLPVFVFALCVLVQFSWSQSITGLAPFAPFQGGGAEIVNLANMNVHISIPVVHKAGRGHTFNYVLNYDSTIWSHNYPYGAWTPAPNWGWRGVSEASIGYITYLHSTTICPNTTAYWITTYVDPAGTTHHLSPAGPTFDGLCNPADNYYIPSGTYVTTDGSAYSLTGSVSSNVLSVSNFRDRSGNLIVAPLIDITTTYPPTNTNGPGSIADSNGNSFSTTGSAFTDTLGMNVLTVSGSNPVKYTYTGPSQTAEAVKVNYSTYTVATTFGCTADTEYPPTPVSLVSSILLADGTSYTFTYEQNGSYYTGRIATLGLPTGGSIQYQYLPLSQGDSCVYGTLVGLTRTLSDGSIWQYAAPNGTPVTVTDPAQNQTVLTTSNGAAVKAQVYQGSASNGTLLQTVTTCYNSQATACTTPTGPPSNGVPAAITVIALPTGGESTQTVTYLNSNTLPTEIDTYDFGASSPTQKELITYQSLTNIADRSNCDQVLVGTSVPSSCGTPTGNTKSLSTASYDALGNLLGTSSWVSGVSSPQYLSRSFQHYSNGLLQTSTDVNNNQTTYGYQNCNNTQAYLSSVSSGGLTTSMTWDCNGGVVTQVKDANNQPTNFGYLTQGSTADPFWRVLSTTDPLGNIAWKTYTTSPPTKETSLAFNNNASGSDVLLTLDGLGRLAMSEVRTAPGSTSFDNKVTYGYGWTSTGSVTGQVLTQTVPGGTALATTQSDALGRLTSTTDGGGGILSLTYPQNDVLRTVGPAPAGENSKQRQVEYDAFGRITSVCELTSTLSGYGTCSQTSSTPKGYFTQYNYDSPVNSTIVTQNATAAVQTRTYQHDGVGRLTSETNPETGSIVYTYDTDSTCGTSNGDLVRKVDAANNVTCLVYDALHRVTGITYPSGPYSASTPKKTFIYDTTTFGCSNPNVKGRLTEGFTGPSSAKVTDIAYCYSPRGETTDAFESTPNSNGYYHTTASYWANGALNVLGGVPSRNAWTFGVDGEGRPNSAVDGTTTHLVTATVYNAASQPTIVSLGSGDSDTYTYDPNTGRMATYQYKVGSTPKYVTSTLGWNQNWSLGSLVIADAFDSANAQNCAYSHDDLARLQSVSCGPTSPNGATWGQTFSYDPFGNISKTGTSSFLPTYTGTGTTPTNQFYQIPGGPTGASHYYDLNGNLTSDLTNTYAWDADGNTVGINLGGSAPINITYDAFDRVVEENNSGTYKQILYSPIGKLALMARQVTNNVFLPLPGGEQATYTGNTIRFRHYDWLGSARFESNMAEAEYGDVAYAPFGETYSIKNTPYLSFTGQQQDTLAGLYDFLYREYSPVQGRWLRPDPAGLAAVDPTNPQSWNRYAYVDNEPTTNIDPSGLCDVVIGGIGQSPGAPNTTAITAFASFIGAELVFPYAGSWTPGGFASVVSQALFGPNSSTDAAVAAITLAANSPGPINIFTLSGGAQAYNTALGSLPSGVRSRINNVTYVSPGGISNLAPGNGSTTVISNSFGLVDNAILLGSVGNAEMLDTNCGHDSNCTFSDPFVQLALAKRAGGSCPANSAGGGGGGGGNGYGYVGGDWAWFDGWVSGENGDTGYFFQGWVYTGPTGWRTFIRRK